MASIQQPIQSMVYDHLQLVDEIPFPYILEKLHQMGPNYLGDRSTAFAELRVEGVADPFWVHKEYLVLQSTFFKDIFDSVSQDDVITICVPSPENFEAILEFLYDGDVQKWTSKITRDNYYNVVQNVEFLGLGPEARAVCHNFCENELTNRQAE